MLALEIVLEHGCKGASFGDEAQVTIEERRILSALSLHFDHQQL